MKTLLSLPILLVALAGTANAQTGKPAQTTDGQQALTFSAKITRTESLSYLLHLPSDYAKSRRKRWPLLLFLHGSGERGSDIKKVKVHGPPKLIEQGKDFPFIVVSPQCPDGRWWDVDVLSALLDSVSKTHRVDKDRIYCTGLSMGGFGTWSLAQAFPDRFAAIAPICGGGDPKQVASLGQLPIWVFHGGKDPVVSVERANDMVNALKAIGSNVKLTVYPEAGHDSWTVTYDNPELYDWLLAQKRARKR